MTTDQDNSLARVASWFVVTMMPVLLAIAGWAMLQIIENDKRLAVLEAEAGKGPRFTLNDFRGVEGILKDHESRIRYIESVR